MNAIDPLKASRDLVQWHRAVLVLSCAILALARALVVLPDDRIALRGLPAYPLPQCCASRVWLGLRCPGCGLTRSIIQLAGGDRRASWHDHRLGGLMAAVIAFQIPYRLLALRRPDRPGISPRGA